MSFLNKLKGLAQGAQAAIEGEVGKLRNAGALDALVGASVMIASADGEITQDEKAKLRGFLQNSALTKVYSVDDILKAFEAHEKRFGFDVETGRIEALRVIGKQRSSPETARTIARLAVMIGKADGDFDAQERTQAEAIIRELGLSPAEFL